ncbi:elongation factor EF-G [Perkinsus olseni]|uniref:Elongation factor EF-G n=1 Tax=Perkinsus olseni TaxID=32597 RepID=A0A7J6N4C0_PEROL|nr:elongation factor EF-G [Perkinsus olseni]
MMKGKTRPVPLKCLKQGLTKDVKTVIVIGGGLAGLVDLDDDLAESFLVDENVPADELERAIRRQTIARKFCPVLLGSAYKNKGVQPLLDAVCKYLPSPGDRTYSGYDQSRNGERVEITPDEKKPFLGMAFKSQDLPPNGTLTYMRVYQGSLKKGQSVVDTKTNKRQSLKKLLRLHSSETREVTSAGPGDIVACTGLDVFSGVTCTDGKINWTMSPLHIPAPVVSLSISPASREDSTKMAKALARFKREDPTFIVSTDPGTKETIVSGMGELHLFIYAERIRREYNANVTTGEPRVNFRETINERVPFDYTHKRQSGGRGQYGKVTGYFEPLSHDEVQEILTKYQGEITPMNASKYLTIFQNNIRGNEIPKNFIAYIEKGFRECLEEGPLTGSAVCNLRIVLEGGKHHEVDSSEVAFKAAAQGAFEQAFYGGSPTILQPVMNVEVTVPTDKTGSLMSGITVRKGLVTGSEALTDLDTLVRAKVPLRNMFGFTTELRSITQGHGEWAMDFHAYEEMPADDQESVKKQYVQRRAREKKLEESIESVGGPDSALIIAGDIGGTNCRLRLLLVSKAAEKKGTGSDSESEEPKTKTQLLYAAKYPTASCPSLEEALARFTSEAPALDEAEMSNVVCVVGLPSDVKNNRVARIANIPHWVDTDGDAIAEKLGLGKIVLLNDFESACWGIPMLDESELICLNSGIPINKARTSAPAITSVLIGPGTGLGEGYLVTARATNHVSAHASEGAWVSFAPQDEEEFELLKFVKKDLGVPRVVVEHLTAGPALPMLTRFYGQKEGMDIADLPKTAPEVAGKYGSCPVCTKACDKAMEILGRELAFLCLKFKPQGGIFLIGNVVDSLRDSILAEGSSLRKGLFHSLYHPILEGIVRDTPINIVDANGVSMGMEGAINRATRLALARL